jgi:hypothetical protein
MPQIVSLPNCRYAVDRGSGSQLPNRELRVRTARRSGVTASRPGYIHDYPAAELGAAAAKERRRARHVQVPSRGDIAGYAKVPADVEVAANALSVRSIQLTREWRGWIEHSVRGTTANRGSVGHVNRPRKTPVSTPGLREAGNGRTALIEQAYGVKGSRQYDPSEESTYSIPMHQNSIQFL